VPWTEFLVVSPHGRRRRSVIAPTAAREWVPHRRRDPALALELARELAAPLPAAHALVHRGIGDLAAARRYLEPAIEDLHDPFLLRDVDAAVRRIQQALSVGERIFVHGDYDVDGITSTFLLCAVLEQLGGRVEYRIPHRTRDGYGLSVEAMEEARRRGCGLVVTVDCGVTALAAVERGRALGLDTIITDHHEPPAVLPAAVAVVNPLRPGCGYPFKALAGVGVAFKLAEALLRDHGGMERAREFLDVVALGTIADVVPLVGENRVLARLGLERLNQKRRLGLKALMEVAGLAGRTVTSGQVAFVLAPRINAGGRMGNAEQGLRLLQARDPAEAHDLAQSLEDDNQLRRRYDEEALVEAASRVETELGWPECASILLWSDHWHAGVIGIVASRLVERFHRPAVLVALDGERGRGSGRSLPGLDLNAILAECADLLEAYGGHAFAAGLTVRRTRLPELRERLERLVRERVSADAYVPRLEIDAEVQLGECDLGLVDWLERMSPHGLDNCEPLFEARDLEIESAAAVGQGRHLKLKVRDKTGWAEAIGFGLGERASEVSAGCKCALAFSPTRNEWQGKAEVQLKVKDVHVVKEVRVP
jgi:single-stranded-DNA-specific exonuclease